MSHSRIALPAIALCGLAALAGCATVDPPEVASCKMAVAAQSASGGSTTHVSTEPVIDGKLVKVRDDSTGSVWRCITDNAGSLSEIDLDF